MEGDLRTRLRAFFGSAWWRRGWSELLTLRWWLVWMPIFLSCHYLVGWMWDLQGFFRFVVAIVLAAAVDTVEETVWKGLRGEAE
jgi:hypothetical protein